MDPQAIELLVGGEHVNRDHALWASRIPAPDVDLRGLEELNYVVYYVVQNEV